MKAIVLPFHMWAVVTLGLDDETAERFEGAALRSGSITDAVPDAAPAVRQRAVRIAADDLPLWTRVWTDVHM